MNTDCIVCYKPTDKVDPDIRGPFCGGEWCTQQLVYGWGSMENVRLFYRSLWSNADGTPRETPLNILGAVKTTPDFYKFVEAGRYRK